MDRVEEQDARFSDEAVAEATTWLLRIREREMGPEELSQWLQWMERDERHAAAFDDVSRAWHGTAQPAAESLAALPWPDQSQLAADGYDGSVSVSEWLAGPRDRPRLDAATPLCANSADVDRRRRVLASLALAASIAIIGIITLPRVARSLAPEAPQTKIVETAFNEHRSIVLADGSVLELGSQSLLLVTMAPTHRRLTLERGEAFFKVAKDRDRPFTVRAGGTSVTAIGTAFNVRHSGTDVVVAVAEGVVQIDATPLRVAEDAFAEPGTPRELTGSIRQLRAGERAIVEDDFRSPPRVSRIDAREVDGWREGRFRYDNEPLSAVVADLSRYSKRRITIGDVATSELRVTGTVFKAGVDSWLDSLPRALPVRTRYLDDGSVLIESAGDPPT